MWVVYCIISTNIMKNIKKLLPFLVITGFLALNFLVGPLANKQVLAEDCGQATGLAIPKECKDFSCDIKEQANIDDCLKKNPLTQWIVFAINLLGVLVVVGASAMLVFAGVEYVASADNPERVKSAKQKIINVIIGIIAFFFMYAFLQWLIPGGIF